MVAGPHRLRRAAGVLALLAAAWLLPGGCGQRMELPEQPELVFVTPEPGTYSFKTTWELPAPSDLALSGLYLFVIENHSRVAVYSSRRSYPARPSLVSEFEDLVAPARIAVAKRDSTFVVVADSGDMRCKIYYWLGGPPLYTFTDSLWRRFSGLEADENLHIYVADAQRDTVMAYDRWGRVLHVVSDYGTGAGYVIDPHGLAYNGKSLIIADTGKNWIQRLDPDTSNVSAPLPPIGMADEELLLKPEDVAVDPAGEFIYVADSGHDRVLKFQYDGTFADTVYSAAKIPEVSPPVSRPRFIAAADSLVFVAEPDSNRLVLLQLAPE